MYDVQAQQEELGHLQQRCEDAEAGNAALASEQLEAAKHATSPLEVSARLQKQLEEAETGAALHIAQLEQAARDAEAGIAALVSEQQEADGCVTSQLKVPCVACQLLSFLLLFRCRHRQLRK